jgi:nucleoside-diphosphate-sugar epimerase
MGVVILGAAGRLGRLIRPVFPDPATWLGRGEVDVMQPRALEQALAGATAVICLAGVTPGSAQPLEMNTPLATATLDAAKAAGVGRVFLFSSAAVYGHTTGPLREDGPATPISPYGTAKLHMERAAAAHPHPNTVLRLGNVAGADAILGNWKPGFALDSYPDGTTPKRSYIGPGALARILARLAALPDLPPLINIAAPGMVQMGALLDAAGLAWHPQPATDRTIAQVALDTSLLETFAGFDPQDSTPGGIVADWQTAKGAK